jgi:hypothetical protein
MIILRNNILSGGEIEERTFNSKAQKARRALSDMKIGLESASTDNFLTNPIDKSYKKVYDKYKVASTTPLVKGGSWSPKVEGMKDISKLADKQESLLKEGRAAQRRGAKSLFNDKFSRIHRLSPEHQSQLFDNKLKRNKSAIEKQVEDDIKKRINAENAKAKIKEELKEKARAEARAKSENIARAEAKAAAKKTEILKNAKLRRIKNLKTVGKVAGGLALASGIGYGGYKYYQYKHNKKK